ncbi:UPF0158 family protein [Actinacidiphila glaucinigra]|uniref:UPF0158 family protein n=1 Tax=Actinacidiphila glaucinigra TaxID=235986 RepID=UPI003D8B5FEF
MAEKLSEEILAELRAASCAGDWSTLVALLPEQPLTDVLQTVGDTVADAAASGVPGAAELAEQCMLLLGERGWEGDEDLAEELEAALGRSPVTMLRPLGVDLDELSGLLEGDPLWGGGRIDLATGACWPEPADVDVDEGGDGDDGGDRWLPVRREGARDGYRDMEWFITTVDDADLAARLEIAIVGRGAFGRFKDVLARSAAERSRYHRFAEERQRGRARAWLAARGYRPAARR